MSTTGFDTRHDGNAVPLPPDGPDTLSRSAALLFAPVDKRAFGAAIGTAAGISFFGATSLVLLLSPESSLGLALMGEYFAGYSVTWPGAVIGLGWGFVVGFCAGWFVAFTRNLVLAVSLFIIRSRAELGETRDFLDHI